MMYRGIVHKVMKGDCPNGCGKLTRDANSRTLHSCDACQFVAILKTMQIDDLVVSIVYSPDYTQVPHTILYEAVCGESKSVVKSMTLPARVDRIQNHLDKDHSDALIELAREAAGHERSRLHLVNLFT